MTDHLSKLKECRNLVSIRREEIDDRRIQAFLLDYSEELVLIKYVYDFVIDGFMVLRQSDISDIKSDKTDLLQTQLLKDEGIYAGVDFCIECDLTCWNKVFSTIGSFSRFITIEDENPEYPLFYLGEILKIGVESVSILGFNGTANWDDDISEIYYENISCVQIGNNYANIYERYFERNAIPKPSF